MMFSQLRTTRPLRHVSVPSPPSMWSSALTPTPPSSRSLPAPPSSVSRPQYAWLSSQSLPARPLTVALRVMPRRSLKPPLVLLVPVRASFPAPPYTPSTSLRTLSPSPGSPVVRDAVLAGVGDAPVPAHVVHQVSRSIPAGDVVGTVRRLRGLDVDRRVVDGAVQAVVVRVRDPDRPCARGRERAARGLETEGQVERGLGVEDAVEVWIALRRGRHRRVGVGGERHRVVGGPDQQIRACRLHGQRTEVVEVATRRDHRGLWCRNGKGEGDAYRQSRPSGHVNWHRPKIR